MTTTKKRGRPTKAMVEARKWEEYWNEVPLSRKDFGDTVKPEYYHVQSKVWIMTLLAIGAVLALLFAMHGDQQALHNGFIH